jgi:pimeloyl-ACP methyl ester carboxylesterase
VTLPSVSRRQLAIGMAGGAFLALGALAKAQGVAGPAQGGARIRQGFQPSRFGEVHYRQVQPAAPSAKVPLLCLHASPGSSIIYLDFLAHIGTDRLVIAADTPGYGLSDRPPTPSTIADFAGAMADLLDGLGLKQVDVLGNHTSSATAVELARQRPGLVRRMVLHSALMFTPQDRAAYRAKMANIAPPDLETALAAMPDRWRALRKARPEWSEERAWAMLWETSHDPMHVGWGYTASFDYDFAAGLAQIRQPILILNPQDELHDITARARSLMPNAQMQDLPWASGSFGIHSAEVAARMRNYLDG